MNPDAILGIALWAAGLLSAVWYYARRNGRKRRGRMIRRQVG